MAKKAGAKRTKATKSAKKAVAGKRIKKAKVAEQPSIPAQIQEPVTMTAPAQEIAAESPAIPLQTDISPQQEAAPVAEAKEEKEEPKTETAAVQEAKEIKTEEKKEDATMGSEKGIGKEYNPSEFSKPAAEAGSGGSKVFLYVGISVVVLAVIISGLFFMKDFGKESSRLTGSTVSAFCSDTDGGYNRFTKGVAEGTYYLDYKTGQFMDECAPTEDNKLTEYYCKNDLVVYATEPCPTGLTCQDGICA